MAHTAHNVLLLSQVDDSEFSLVGQEGILLAKLENANIQIPKSFIITSSAFFDFARENNLSVKIKHLILGTNFESQSSLEQLSAHIKKIILEGVVSEVFIKETLNYYRKLGSLIEEPQVKLILSLTEGSESFQNTQSFLSIKGDAVLIDKVKAVWASAYTPGLLLKRHREHEDVSKVEIAVVVQTYVNSTHLGKIFTVDTKNNDKSKVIISENIEIRKLDLAVLNKTEESTLSDKQLKKLASIAIDIEKLLYFPQNISFAIEKDKIFILKTKPLTFYSDKDSEFVVEKLNSHVALSAEPASAGIAAGPLRFVLKEEETNKTQPGDVIVLSESNPDFLHAIKKASAVITLNGGRNSYAATTARKFGIPAIANAKDVVKSLNSGHVVTVNGTKGEVYKGGFSTPQTGKHLKTATKLYVSVSNPNSLENITKLNLDGVNPLKAEAIIKNIGTHPKKMIEDGRREIFVSSLSDSLEKACKNLEEKPVVYRFSDLKTNEYSKLVGGKELEPEESNPSLGFRGAFRYLHDKESFKMELDAVKNVREKGYVNLSVAIPFARTPEELSEVKKIISTSGLLRSSSFKIWLTLETPSNVIMLENFIETGIDGVSIDTNMLTTLTMGTDRENFEVSGEFNGLQPALLWSLEHVIRTANKYKIDSTLYGLGVSENAELIKRVIGFGIGGISVLPDGLDYARKLIYQTEKNLLIN